MGSTSIRGHVTVSSPAPKRFGPTFRDHLTPAYDEGSPYLKISHDHFLPYSCNSSLTVTQSLETTSPERGENVVKQLWVLISHVNKDSYCFLRCDVTYTDATTFRVDSYTLRMAAVRSSETLLISTKLLDSSDNPSPPAFPQCPIRIPINVPVLRFFPQYLHVNAGILLQITPRSRPSNFFPIYYSLLSPSSDAIQPVKPTNKILTKNNTLST